MTDYRLENYLLFNLSNTLRSITDCETGYVDIPRLPLYHGSNIPYDAEQIKTPPKRGVLICLGGVGDRTAGDLGIYPAPCAVKIP